MTKTDRAFRALAQAEADTVIALMSVAGIAVRGKPLRPKRLPTRLDPLPPSQDVDLLLRTGKHALRHIEAQGYRDARFDRRVLEYHLHLALRHPDDRVRTVALWLTAPPASMRRDRVRHHDITVRIASVVLREVSSEALLADPATACFAPGGDAGDVPPQSLCDRVVARLKSQRAPWVRWHMAVVAAASVGRYKEIVKAMEEQRVEPVIIEDLIHIGEDLGLERGREEGRREGMQQGMQQGIAAMRRAVLELMASRSLRVTAALRRRVEACDDLAQLTAWFDRALLAERARDVFGAPVT